MFKVNVNSCVHDIIYNFQNRRNDSEDGVEIWKDDVEDVLKRVCDEVESIHRSMFYISYLIINTF